MSLLYRKTDKQRGIREDVRTQQERPLSILHPVWCNKYRLQESDYSS